MLIRLLLAASLTGYAAAWLLQVLSFRGGDIDHRLRVVVLAGGATLAHVGALVTYAVTTRSAPLVGLGPVSASLGLALVCGFLIASRTRERWAAGLLVLPIVAALVATSLVVAWSPVQPGDSSGAWLVVHVVLVLAGWASLLLASVAAAMYLFQFRALKEKEFGNVFRVFPSLESLDRMNRIGLAAGLSALAVGVLSGWSLTVGQGRGLAIDDPDVGFGLITWAAYAVAIATRRWSPGFDARAATASVLAAIASAIAFFAFRGLSSPSGLFL